ncbi:MAG: YceI family protein [Bdellovibrionales bacterium]|nr:YceI family protein [Bdellovibrionales bacterium]
MKSTILFLSLLASNPAIASIYNFETGNGEVVFNAKGKPALITIKGEGKGPEGQLTENEGMVSGELLFELDSLKTGIDLRDEHMKKKYLEVEKFPKAKLTLNNFKYDESGKSTPFKGTLELHGVSKEVEGVVRVSGKKEKRNVEAKFPIRLSLFNIDIPSFQGITVAEDVTVQIEATANAKN